MDIDTSSYPKLPTNPPSFLDTASKYGALQQQQQAIQSNQLTIQNQQLNLLKQRFNAVAGQIPGLISKPDLNEQDIVNFYTNNQKEKLMDPETTATEIGQIPPTAGMPPAQATLTLKNWLGQKLQMAQSTMEALNYHLGQGGSVNTGAQIAPTLASPKPGFAGNPQAGGIIAPQAGIPAQLPPTQQYPSPGGAGNPPMGTPVLRQSAPSPTGLPTAPGALPVGPMVNPPRNIQGMGGNITGINVGPDQNMGGVPSAGAPNPVQTSKFTPVGTSPLFDAGKTQYVNDQQIASQKSQSLIPIMQAIPMLKDIMAGPGTATYNNALAGLKAFGIVSTSDNDPVAIRQEVVKKLNQYVSASPVGQRSDAAQTLTEASSPNPNVQILPALIKLAQDAVGQDRITASMPGA